MTRRAFFILLLTVIFSSASCADDSATSFTKAPPPSWVKKCDFPIDPPVKPSQISIQYLLKDIQDNWEEQTTYFHDAKKVLNKEGSTRLGKLEIIFSPFEKIILHSLNVLRDGKYYDRLESSRNTILQREQKLDEDIYNGRLTLVFFLEDIRVGDILEYSFSVIGSHPVFNSHYANVCYLQDDSVVEKRSYRLLIHPDQKLSIKPFHTSNEPEIIDLSPSLREYSLEIVGGESVSTDRNIPAWYNPYPRLQLSQYPSWESIMEKEVVFYSLSNNFISNPPIDMVQLVNKWKKSTKDPVARATLALRFVQDEVRYLGFEEGVSAIRPTDPKVVFQRRFGDCKDKTMLLHALLKLMDIPSTPVLVHMKAGKRLTEILPFPGAFDHVILQIQIGKSSYFVDTTKTFQGGNLKESYLPNYQWGLPVFSKSSKLIPLPKPSPSKPEEITSKFIFKEPDFADLTIETCYYGNRANEIRNLLDQKGLKGVSQDFENFTRKKYNGATLTSPITFSDDRNKNFIRSVECYRVPARECANAKSLKIHSFVIENCLHNNIQPERTQPYALSYPFWVKEHIHVENPFNTWSPNEDTLDFEHTSFQYSHLLKTGAHILDFSYEIKHLQDYVEVDDLKDYWKIINEIEPKGTVEVIIKNDIAEKAA